MIRSPTVRLRYEGWVFRYYFLPEALKQTEGKIKSRTTYFGATLDLICTYKLEIEGKDIKVTRCKKSVIIMLDC